MNDLFSKALTALPAYMSQVLGLLSGPKAFVLRKDLETSESANEAYTFLAITVFISLIAEVSILTEQKDYLLTFASLTVIAAIWLLLMSAALYLAWRIVGGKLSFRISFIVSCYFSGISTLILVVFTLMASGFLRTVDPDAAVKLFHGSAADATGVGIHGYWILMGLGFVAVYSWLVVAWGAYRSLNDVSRTSSAIALALFTAMSPFLLGIQALMQANLVSAQDRATSGRLPQDMVGDWTSAPGTGSEAVPFAGTTYTFWPDGSYSRTLRYVVKQGGCTRSGMEKSSGHASVDGSMLVLLRKEGTRTEMNSCSPGESTSNLDVFKEIFPFEIGHLPNGWRLCLSGRYAQQCFAPT